MASKAETVCALCGNPASTVCGGCKSDTHSRYYCSKACQVNDRKKHKEACKDAQNLHLEKALKRITEIVQQAFYRFRKNTWYTPTVNVVENGGFLYIQNANILEQTDYFVKFPEHLATSKQTEYAMLSAICCRDPLAWMHTLIAALIEGLDVKVKEITVRLHRVRRVITFHSPPYPPMLNWPNSFHELLSVKSVKTKKTWVIDITGPQYGISPALWAWDDYQKEYSASFPVEHPFGWNRFIAKVGSRDPGYAGLWVKIACRATGHLNAAIKSWAERHGSSIAKIITLEEEGYKEAKDSLLEAMNNATRSFVSANQFHAEFQATKLYELIRLNTEEHDMMLF